MAWDGVGAMDMHCTLFSPGDMDLGHSLPLVFTQRQWASLCMLAWHPEGEFLEAVYGGDLCPVRLSVMCHPVPTPLWLKRLVAI